MPCCATNAVLYDTVDIAIRASSFYKGSGNNAPPNATWYNLLILAFSSPLLLFGTE